MVGLWGDARGGHARAAIRPWPIPAADAGEMIAGLGCLDCWPPTQTPGPSRARCARGGARRAAVEPRCPCDRPRPEPGDRGCGPGHVADARTCSGPAVLPRDRRAADSMDDLLTGALDLDVDSVTGPGRGGRERPGDGQAARQAGTAGFVIKSYNAPTADRANLCDPLVSGVGVVGVGHSRPLRRRAERGRRRGGGESGARWSGCR